MMAQRKRQDALIGEGVPSSKLAHSETTAVSSVTPPNVNRTGMPDGLKRGIEAMSGLDMSHTRVHRNSSKPAQLQAFAYAQGSDIYLGPGQEKHLPHEAWHVVQQAQGRVKATTQRKSGIQINDDVGLESEADVMGASAARWRVPSTEQPHSVSFPAVHAALPMQAKWAPAGGSVLQLEGVAVDVLKEAGGFAWDYTATLLRQSGLSEEIGKIAENACLYLVNRVVKLTSLSDYLEVMSPYLAILRKFKLVLDLIPMSIRTMLLYGIGVGIDKFSKACMYGAIGEAQIATLLNAGTNSLAVLGGVIEFLDNLAHNTTATLYRGIWSAARLGGLTAVGSLTEWYLGKPAPTQEPRKEAIPSSDVRPSQPKMIDTNLGWFWMNVDQPRISTWKDEKQVDRGGIEVNAGFGAKIFDHVMGASNVQIQVPFDGDWSATFTDVMMLSGRVGLDGIIEAGGIGFEEIRIGNAGLRAATLVIKDLQIGGGIVDATKISASYEAGHKELRFGADVGLKVLGETFNSKLSLGVGTDGTFRDGSLTVSSPGTFSIVKDKLSIAKPSIGGSFKKGMPAEIKVEGDVLLKLLASLEAAGRHVSIAYEGEKGFVGRVDELNITVAIGDNDRVTLLLLNGRIDRNGFTAEKIQFLYRHARKPKSSSSSKTKTDDSGGVEEGVSGPRSLSSSEVGSVIPGFNMQWLNMTGLDVLEIDVGASGIKLDTTGLSVGALHKRITQLHATLFGASAAFDGNTGKGALTGKVTHSLSTPSLHVDFPILPGFNGSVGLGAKLELGAAFNATLARQSLEERHTGATPWALGASAIVSAKGSVTATAGLSLGVPMIATINASLFASATAALEAEAGVRGVLLIADNDNAVSLSRHDDESPRAIYSLSAILSAELGAQVSGKLFFIFDKQLWQYQFGEWNLGQYRVAGEIRAKESGGYEVVSGEQGFADGQPNKPVVSYKVLTVAEMVQALETNGKTIKDERELHRLVHDVADPNVPIDRVNRLALYERIKTLNKTGVHPDQKVLEVMRQFNQRVIGNTLSEVMTRSEWIRYSTTSGIFGDTDRRSVTQVDELVDDYHKAAPSQQLTVLDQLIEAGNVYMRDSGKTRRSVMVAKLLEDAQRERLRLKAL